MAVCRKSPRTHFGTPVYAGGLHLDNSSAISTISAGPSGSACSGTSPGLRYRENVALWEYSNDGVNWYAISGSGGSTGSVDGTIPLGIPPDGDYSDGYFNFLTTTQVNDAIDRINELLLSVTGSGSAEYKTSEFLVANIPADTAHTLPASETFSLGSGSYLDIFVNGQLLTHTNTTRTFDYEEVTTSTVKFTEIVPVSSLMTYVVRRRP